MAAIEKLLTMGLAHGVDPRRMLEVSFGSTQSGPDAERITWEDVTRAVVALAPSYRAVLYLKAAPALVTAKDLASLTSELWFDLISYDMAHHTYRADEIQRGLPDKRQAAIIRTALAEYCDPRTCRRCIGGGEYLKYIEGKGMVTTMCERCGGYGYVPWSDRRRARSVAVDRTHWTARWAPGYEATLRNCTGLYRQAAEGFKAVLFGDESAPAQIEARNKAQR